MNVEERISQTHSNVIPFAPMLASTAMPAPGANDFVLEPKFDGWRVIVAVDDRVRVWTRRGHELTERLPELASLANALDRRVVLDGELVAEAGRARDFCRALGRVGARAQTDATDVRRLRRPDLRRAGHRPAT